MAHHTPHGPYERWIKRPWDCVLASTALVALSPVMLVTAALVRVKLGSPVLFTQNRPGKDEKVFRLYKFRTMTDERGADGELLPDSARLSSFGEALRTTSIDELPELLNIVKGDMAIVGPRPWVPEYHPYFTEEKHHRHDVRPGLTGLAQVNGRTASTWDERLRFDLEYVQTITFIADCKIVLKTFIKVFRKSDILVDGESQGDFDKYRISQWEMGKHRQEMSLG